MIEQLLRFNPNERASAEEAPGAVWAPPGDRRFWSMFPFTMASHFGYPNYPQPEDVSQSEKLDPVSVPLHFEQRKL